MPGHNWFSLPDRRIRTNIGKWKPFGRTTTIKRGKTINIGTMKTFDYVDQGDHQTGWVQHEYERITDIPAFESVVVVHLFFDPVRNNTPPPQQQANLAQNIAQINAGNLERRCEWTDNFIEGENQIDEGLNLGLHGQNNEFEQNIELNQFVQLIQGEGIQLVNDGFEDNVEQNVEQDQIVEGGELFVEDIHVEINEADDHGLNHIIEGENQIDDVGQNYELEIGILNEGDGLQEYLDLLD
ncbi:unnamed protein product [Arabis nemorensis]|uniref:NAC domain-containing protein n=1 Tax=Arabis nemorensis TaxID=586526 RepID=A0A565ATA8_9BRAS|nr:unnamed protein product [Arabis nemorensis]